MITIKEEFVGGAKIVRAVEIGGWPALGLWLAMKCYAAENLTDGFVPDEVIEKLRGAPKNARKLLPALVDCGTLKPDGTRKSGLVDPHPHGWQLHDYLDHANSAEQELERRRKERERKANYRAGQRGTVPVGQPRDNARDTPRDSGTHRTAAVPPVPGSVPPDSHAQARVRTPAGASPAQPSPAQPDPERDARTPDRFADSFAPSGEIERAVFRCWAKAFMPSATFDAARASCLLERVRDGMTEQDGADAVAGAMADEWINGSKDGKMKRQLRAVFGTADSYEGFREAGKALRERPSGIVRRLPSVAERIAADEAASAADRAARGLRAVGDGAPTVPTKEEFEAMLNGVGGSVG